MKNPKIAILFWVLVFSFMYLVSVDAKDRSIKTDSWYLVKEIFGGSDPANMLKVFLNKEWYIFFECLWPSEWVVKELDWWLLILKEKW